MKNLYQTIYDFLDNKRSSIYVLAVCIAAKALLIFFYSYTGRDKIYSLSASYNLLQGKGWTNSFFYTDNINKEVLEPFCHWPPGYGLLITPFQALFTDNIFLSTSIFEILCFVAFILLCRSILQTQKLPVAWINLSTIVLSFFSHDFIETSLGTDLLALNFLLGFFYCSIRLWSIEDHRRLIVLGILGGSCLFFAGFIRYMYVPVSLFIGVVLVFTSYLKKNRPAFKGYVIALVSCAAGLGAAMLYQDAACGSPFYTGIKEKGIFIENLAYWHPATIAAFVNLNFVPVQLGKVSPVSYSSWLQVFSWINWIIYVVIAGPALRYFSKVRNTAIENFPVFELVGFILAVSIIGELALLSLTNAVKPTVTGGSWTYIVEGRYHAFPVVFLQLFFLTRVSRPAMFMKFKNLFQSVLSVCFLLLLVNCIHQVYFTTKVGINYKAMKKNVVREQDYVYFESFLKKTIDENRGKDILVTSTDAYYPLLASMHGAKGIADALQLNNWVPVVDKPAVLLVAVSGGARHRYASYLENNDVTLVKEVAGTKFYMQLLNPAGRD